MPLTLKKDNAARPNVMYIRGIPFKCPGSLRDIDTQATANAGPASCKVAGTRPSRQLSRFATSDGTRAVVSKGEADSQGLFMNRRREVRVFSDRTVPMRQLRELLDVDVEAHLLRFVMVEAPSSMDRITGLVSSWLRREGIMADDTGQDTEARKRVFGNAPHIAVINGRNDNIQSGAACALAAARLEWMASEMGLGACFAGEIVRAAVGSSEIAAALAVPTGYSAMAALLLGYPGQPAAGAGQSRPNWITWL